MAAGASAQEAPDDAGLSKETLAAAEKLVPISYTEPERAQILNGIESQLAGIAALRAQNLENELAPAQVFDPRLPGKEFPQQENHLRPAIGSSSHMKTDADLAFASLGELGHAFRHDGLRSEKLSGIYLDRIAKYTPQLECFVTITADLAMAQAQQADRDWAAGIDHGPLHGMPFGIKDLFDTKDILTTWGATPYKDRIAKSDAHIVTKLREAGAVLLGKTTCGAIAYNDIWFGGKTRNPWNMAEGSSGSSAGSASGTAAGLMSFSIGTETLGSIVSPSNRCGATGLRPTFGRVSRAGAMALCWSLDKVGAICRSAEDTALVLSVLNGKDTSDAGSLDHGFAYDHAIDPKSLTIGYDPAWFEGDGPQVQDRIALQTLLDLGVNTKKITVPELPYGALVLALVAESAAAFEELTLSGRDDLMKWQGDNAWPNSWRQIRFLSAVDYVQIDRLRRRVMHNMDRMMEEVDMLVLPNFAANLLTITNFTGHPCLTLRSGFIQSAVRDDPNLPKGAPKTRVPHNISLIGRLFDEGRMVALGGLVETKLGIAKIRPPGF
jgi:Asp-tRNA(Asn)/Glu-tRNA(Gln) amidotransferase A subunit family amidase